MVAQRRLKPRQKNVGMPKLRYARSLPFVEGGVGRDVGRLRIALDDGQTPPAALQSEGECQTTDAAADDGDVFRDFRGQD